MCVTQTAAQWLATLAALALPAALSAAPDSTPLAGVDWRRGGLGERASRILAVAREPRSGELAVGDDDGILIGRPGQAFRRVRLRGAVADLDYTADGTLLAATARGLLRLDAAGRRSEGPPAPGAAARVIHRIAALPGLTALATDAGVFVSRDSRGWQRLSGTLPAGPAAAIALQRRGEAFRCWVSVAGELWRVDLREDGSGFFEATAFERVVMPFADRVGGALDLVADVGSRELVVVFPRSLAVWRSGAAKPGWQTLRPELPPGAGIRRLARGAGRWWLATNRGLLAAPDLAGPWRRSSPPAGSAGISDVVAAADIVVVASDEGLLIGRPRAAAGVAVGVHEASPGLAIPPDPPIARVHRAALRYLGLERSRLEALRRGVRRRGWWPLLTVRSSADWDRSRNTDHDQSFISGDTRHLVDRETDRDRGYAVSLSMTWDLGDIAYHPEFIDVSHEARELIELRDDVLDEITQLYFERRAVLAALRAPGPPSAADSLRRRADELAAGIDAWTGGWFTAQPSAPAP